MSLNIIETWIWLTQGTSNYDRLLVFNWKLDQIEMGIRYCRGGIWQFMNRFFFNAGNRVKHISDVDFVDLCYDQL